jgi:hypothetical protein
MSEDYELVQVHINGNKAEVLIRNKNGFRAFGGILKEVDKPKSVYPPNYFSDKTTEGKRMKCPKCKNELLAFGSECYEGWGG